MPKTYTATVTIRVEDDDVEGPVRLSSLQDYLAEAVCLDIDTETYGSNGVVGIAIDWDTLKQD